MSDQSKTKKIISAGIGYILGSVLVKGIAFITTPIFSRLLTTEEFGVFNTFISYESILAMFIGFQFAGCLKNAKIKYANDSAGIDAFFSHLIVLMIFHSALVLIIVNLFPSLVMNITGIDSVFMLNLLVLTCLGNSAMTVYTSFVSLEYQYKKYILISVINAIANVVLSLLFILVVMTNDKSSARLFGYIIPYIGILIFVVITAFRKKFPNICDQKKYCRFAYGFCTPLIPNGFAEVMLTQYSKLSVAKHCGASEMGIYSLSYNVYSIVATVKLGMDYIIGPFYFDKRSEGDFESLRRMFGFYSRSLAVITSLVMLVTPEIVRIIGDKEYYDARLSAIPLIAVSFFSFLCYMISQEEYYVQKPVLVSVISVASMILNILLCSIFVPSLGGVGAAYCTLIAFVFMFVFHFVVTKIILKSESFSWLNLFIDGAFVVFMSVVSMLIVDNNLFRFVAIVINLIVASLFMLKNLKCVSKLIKR